MKKLKTPVIAMSSVDDTMSDDVFESVEEAEGSTNKPTTNETNDNQNRSSTGYRDYKPKTNVRNPSDPSLKIVHKTILLGDSGVGKTSLLVRFDTGQFQTGNFSATVGIGFTNKVISVEDSKVKLQIWDTAGQERFRSVTHAYYRDAHALLLLYDVTNRTSFDNIRAWLSEIRDYANDQVVIMLLGNKADCSTNDRVIKKEEGEKLAQEYSVTFMETSAKSGLNVDVAFMAVARELLFKKTGVEINKGSLSLQDYVREQTKTNCSSCYPA